MLAFLLVFACNMTLGQPKPTHSANKAALYSALLPGLGQAYNDKYWKIPVVYAGFGVIYYFIHSNNVEYQKFKDAYSYKSGAETDPDLYNDYVDKYPLTSLQDGKEYYRRNRDLSIIIGSFWYLLNITDAAVDAYLFDYDVSPDLSLRLTPYLPPPGLQTRTTPGLTLTFDF